MSSYSLRSAYEQKADFTQHSEVVMQELYTSYEVVFDFLKIQHMPTKDTILVALYASIF